MPGFSWISSEARPSCPPQPIQRGPKGTFVYVVKSEEPTVTVREVTVGVSQGEETSIETGCRRVSWSSWMGPKNCAKAARSSCGLQSGPVPASQETQPTGAEPMKQGNRTVNPSRLFILRPVATVLTMVAILLAGASPIASCLFPPSPGRLSDHPSVDVLSRCRARTSWPLPLPRRWNGSSGKCPG